MAIKTMRAGSRRNAGYRMDAASRSRCSVGIEQAARIAPAWARVELRYPDSGDEWITLPGGLVKKP